MKRTSHRHLPRGVFILHEDRDILVVEKPVGLLTVGTDREKERTLHHALMNYVCKGNSKCRNRIFVVHRLDRDVSGVLLFAKTHAVKELLQERWGGAQKIYQAIVHGTMEERTGVLSSYLTENNSFTVYATTDTRKGKLSYTEYKVLKEANGVSLLAINLLTGRKHQIRVHLADEGHPIVGDKKYGLNDRLSKRLALHATSITFNHPHSGVRMTIESPIPSLFHRLLTGQSCI